MSPLSRWIFGTHVFLGAWLLLGYATWREITAPSRVQKSYMLNIRLAVVCVITLFLLYFSLNLMDSTYLIPKFND